MPLLCLCSKCKLYRFDHDAGEWKERGVGQVRLLESKANKKIRLLHRQEKTLKIRANHIRAPPFQLASICCELQHTQLPSPWAVLIDLLCSMT